VLFASPSEQNDGAILSAVGNHPILIDFVKVVFATWFGGYLGSPATGMAGPFDDTEDDDVANLVFR
jgi:hypothetical protein